MRASQDWPPARLALLLAATVLLHAVLAATLPLSGDEAYYWDCSRHLDWSYFDQPPLVIWLMIPFRAVLGETSLAVRGPALLASLLTAVFLVPLVRRLGGGRREAGFAYALLHATPLVFLGSFYASTDVAMVAAYCGATWAAVALAQGERRAWWGFGIATGLGFLAKFPVVAVLAVLIPLVACRSVRRDLLTPVPYLAGALSLALTSPVWIWGAQHRWDNLAFQAGRVPEGGVTVRYLLEFMGANLLIAGPILGVVLVLAWWRAGPSSDLAWRVYRVAAVAPLALFGLFSLRGQVAAHWGAPSIVLAAPALTLWRFRGRRVWLGAAVATAAPFIALLLSFVVFAERWIEVGAFGALTRPLAAVVAAERAPAAAMARLAPGERLASQSYSTVHLLAFASGGSAEVYLGNVNAGRHGLASLYWRTPEECLDHDYLFVSVRDLTAGLAPVCTTVEELSPEPLTAGKRTIGALRFYRCRRLRVAEGAFSRLPSTPTLAP